MKAGPHRRSWPVGERIPRNRDEALKLGWTVAGGRTIREDELTDLGEVYMQKKLGTLCLALTLPWRLERRYGRARGHRVIRRGGRP